LGRGLERDIAQWYRGTVQFIIDLRPHTIVKDEAIPALLRQRSQPTFVTINDRDFWRKVAPDQRYCIMCFALSDAHARGRRSNRCPATERLFDASPTVAGKSQPGEGQGSSSAARAISGRDVALGQIESSYHRHTGKHQSPAR
jgi:hypothetical protein